MSSSSDKPTNILKESLGRIHTRLLSDKKDREGYSGGPPATLQDIRLTQIYDAQLVIVEELLGSLDSEPTGSEIPRNKDRPLHDSAESSQVSSRVALRSIFAQKQIDHGNQNLSNQNPSSMKWLGGGSSSTLERRRRSLIQDNNKAIAAKKAQQLWRNNITLQANVRKEEALGLQIHLREERTKVQNFEEEIRQRALREATERQGELEAEAAAREAAAEAGRRAREVECSVCFETFDMGVAARLPCTHWYCWDHLAGMSSRRSFELTQVPLTNGLSPLDAFEAALNSRRQFRCCNEPVPVEILANSPMAQPDFVDGYVLMVLEQSTPNPVYCCQPECAIFIPPIMARGPDEMVCPACNTSTCRHCKGVAHGNQDCPQDVAMQRLNELAGMRGWRNCPRCNAMIERIGKLFQHRSYPDSCLHPLVLET
jgi:hypothetical protein